MVADFKRGRTSVKDDSHEGRSKSATTPIFIAEIQMMV